MQHGKHSSLKITKYRNAFSNHNKCGEKFACELASLGMVEIDS